VLCSEALQDECEIYSFEDSQGKKHYQGVALSKVDSNIACVFSLPTITKNIYITLSDGDTAVVRRVLAMLEEVEIEDSVALGNVLLLDSVELQTHNIVGVILLPINVSNALNCLPAVIPIEKVEYTVLLVVFLTQAEHHLWVTQGHDALMDLFSGEGKDLVAFGKPN
jgi:hypothetical protein